MKNNSYIFAFFITILGVLLMSVESLLIKMTNISGITYSFYIGILMFVSLNAILLKDGFDKTLAVYKESFKVILIIGILTSFSNMLFINSIKHTTIANAAIIISSSPLFAALFAYLFYREKPKKNIFIASFFIFIGLVVIFAAKLKGGNLFGDILALFCTMTFSLIFVILAREKNVNRFAIIAFAGICITFISSFFVQDYSLDTKSLYILLIAGLLVSPFSRIFMMIGIKTLPASEVSLLTILETILAPIWAWLFLNEIISKNTLIGGFIIISTLILNTLYLMKASKVKSFTCKE